MKTVKHLLYAHTVDMGGIPVKQPLPTQKITQIDPFLLFHHHISDVQPGSRPFAVGVGPHPHRGFSPVTFIFQGAIHHRDSRGNSAIVEAGGVQWMSAGSGLIHSERPAAHFAEQGGTQEIIQIWINTPASKKMDQPFYKAVQKGEIPFLTPKQGTGYIQLVAGKSDAHTGPIHSHPGLLAAMGQLDTGSAHTFRVQENHSTLLYLLDGALTVEGYGLVDELNLVHFENAGTDILVKALDQTRFLLLSAPALNEPVASYGPFVMNNQTQIMEAMRDYQKGKMGILIEE